MLLVLRVGDEFQVVRIPAGIDAASVVELSTFWDGTAKELPAEPVGVTVLSLGDAPVWRGVPMKRQQVPSWGWVGSRTVRSIRRSSSERRPLNCRLRCRCDWCSAARGNLTARARQLGAVVHKVVGSGLRWRMGARDPAVPGPSPLILLSAVCDRLL